MFHSETNCILASSVVSKFHTSRSREPTIRWTLKSFRLRRLPYEAMKHLSGRCRRVRR